MSSASTMTRKADKGHGRLIAAVMGGVLCLTKVVRCRTPKTNQTTQSELVSSSLTLSMSATEKPRLACTSLSCLQPQTFPTQAPCVLNSNVPCSTSESASPFHSPLLTLASPLPPSSILLTHHINIPLPWLHVLHHPLNHLQHLFISSPLPMPCNCHPIPNDVIQWLSRCQSKKSYLCNLKSTHSLRLQNLYSTRSMPCIGTPAKMTKFV